MRTHHLPRIILPILSTLGAAACGVGPSISGQLGATATGDLSNPPAERGDGRTALTQACTQAAPGVPSYSFDRTPYLQLSLIHI